MILTAFYSVVTGLLIIAFIGLCAWAYSPSRHDAFNEYANIPLLEEDIEDHQAKRDISQ